MTDLGRALDLAPSTVAKKYNGERDFWAHEIPLLMDFLGVTDVKKAWELCFTVETGRAVK